MESKVTKLLGCQMPSLAPEIASYVTSVVCDESNELGGAADEVYEAVGEILSSSSATATDSAVKDLCAQLARLLQKDDDGKPPAKVEFESATGHRVLPGAVDMNVATPAQEEELTSIFLVKKDDVSNVDAKKLARAEEKNREKKERRNLKDERLPPPPPQKEVTATASQAQNKGALNDDNSTDIRLYSVDVSFGDKQLLSGANLILAQGRRYGLVGRNGIGKTTFFKMISGKQLEIPGRIKVLHVEQEVTGDDTTVLQSVLAADERREELLRLEKELSRQIAAGQNDVNTTTQLDEIYAELEAKDSAKAPAIAATILAGLGFTADEQVRPTKEFSGGWRMRMALARGLFLKPDLLMLDEPTNMLDMKAIYWLEDHLQQWPSTLFVVSHDRNFLNAICTDVVLLANRKLENFRGNYDCFEKVKEEKLKQQQRDYDSQMAFRAHAQEFIDKFRYNAKRASLVQSKIKMLEKLPPVEAVDPEARVVLKFPDCEALNPPVLQLDAVTFKYPTASAAAFKDVDVGADTDSRICIVGENGAGKTTLLKLLRGDLEPSRGQRNAHRGLKVAYFAQHHVDQLDMNLTPLHLAAQRFPGHSAEEYRTALGRFGVTGDLALQSIPTLSGGQKSRLAFALIALAAPNFMILDEPTNHLDVESVEALGKALNEYKGGVVLVSHDERLIQLVCKELWVVRDGTVQRLEGGLPEYRRIILAQLKDA